MASVAKIQRLALFVQQNPALADVPIGTVLGRPITPRQALETDWELAEAYYRSLLAKPAPRPTIYVLPKGAISGQEITIEEALEHIRRRDRIGLALLQSFEALKREMARRMR